MANKNSVFIYRLSDKGRKMGIHTVCTPPDKDGPGTPYKIDNGLVKIPWPGLPHPDAHHLTLIDVTGDGGSDLVDPELIKLHEDIAAAEKAQAEAKDILADAKKAVEGAKNAEAKKKAEDQVKEAEALVATADEKLAAAMKAAEGRF